MNNKDTLINPQELMVVFNNVCGKVMGKFVSYLRLVGCFRIVRQLLNLNYILNINESICGTHGYLLHGHIKTGIPLISLLLINADSILKA